MSLLEQDIIRKKQTNKFLELELNAEKDNKYEVEVIKNSTVYNKDIDDKLPG